MPGAVKRSVEQMNMETLQIYNIKRPLPEVIMTPIWGSRFLRALKTSFICSKHSCLSENPAFIKMWIV